MLEAVEVVVGSSAVEVVVGSSAVEVVVGSLVVEVMVGSSVAEVVVGCAAVVVVVVDSVEGLFAWIEEVKGSECVIREDLLEEDACGPLLLERDGSGVLFVGSVSEFYKSSDIYISQYFLVGYCNCIFVLLSSLLFRCFFLFSFS